jgi:hypothetical protein
VLDCWKEGEFDYVAELAILANYGPAFYAYNNSAITSPLGITTSNFFSVCLGSWRTVLKSAPYVLSDATFTALVTNSLQLTFAGFWWKPSYASEGTYFSHYFCAMNFYVPF